MGNNFITKYMRMKDPATEKEQKNEMARVFLKPPTKGPPTTNQPQTNCTDTTDQPINDQ